MAFGVLMVACVGIVVTLALRNPPGSGGSARARAVRRDGLRTLAGERGWWAGEGEDVASRRPDHRLTASLAKPQQCDFVIDGGADGFVAETWSVRVGNLASPLGIPARQHLIRLPCPGVPDFLVRSLPGRHELRHFPVRFRGRSGFVQFHAQMLIGGDFAAVQDRIAPFVVAVEASRLWVIGLGNELGDGLGNELGDELVLMSTTEPDAAEFERRLELGRALVTALT